MFYVWVFDLFFYSNTELFPVFFIFFTFGIFVFHLIVWYRDYLDESISAENRNLYIMILALQKRFVILKSFSEPRFNDTAEDSTKKNVVLVSNLAMVGEFIQVFGLAMQKHSLYTFQLSLFKYFQNLLGQMRAIEFGNYQSLISCNLISLMDQVENTCAVVISPANYVFSSANSIFLFFINEFCYPQPCNDDFLFSWTANLPISNFTDIV
jgi:hypothetical protein